MIFRTLLISLFLLLPLKADDRWTKTEITLEVAYQLALFVDWKQTSEFHRSTIYYPDGSTYTIHERNWLLGENPKQSAINIACLVSSLGHLWISHMLGHDRIVWQTATLSIELLVVNNNFNAGVKIRW